MIFHIPGITAGEIRKSAQRLRPFFVSFEIKIERYQLLDLCGNRINKYLDLVMVNIRYNLK